MNLREYTSTETSAFVERLTAAAEAELEKLRADADLTRQDAAAVRQQVETLLAEGVDLRAQVEAAQASIQREAVRADVLERRVQESDATVSALRTQSNEANVLTTGVQAELATLRAQKQQVVGLLGETIEAFDALATASTVADLFTKLIEQVATQFPRVVIFRRKGPRLEGDLATGLEDSVDLADLAVTMSEDSIITTAATLGVYEYGTAEQLVDSHRLPGDVPAFAVAAPLVFQGETLAVVYADTTEKDKGEAHAAFAGVLAAHTNVLLSRLTQELKVARELREYAQMLLHEAEEMFVADTNEGRTRQDRLRRLRDTIDFGRQLYAQRATLEGPGASGLLEEEISSLVDTEPASDFSSALADALADSPVAKTAS